MTSILHLVLLVTALQMPAALQLELQCNENEVQDDCPATCASDYCPKSDEELQTCPVPSVCLAPACKCQFNYRRATNGVCIPTKKCPPFDCSHRINEEYDPCPPYCPTDDCSQASPDSRCPLNSILITQFCSPACRCIRNYWRKNGVCVPYRQCFED